MGLSSWPGATWLFIPAIVILFVALLASRRSRRRGGQPALSLLIVVRNQAATVEGFMREVCSLAHGPGGLGADVTVVDAGSEDETFEILERLGRRLPFKLARWQGRENQASSALDLGYVLCERPAVLLLHLTEPGRAVGFVRLLKSLAPGAAGRAGESMVGG